MNIVYVLVDVGIDTQSHGTQGVTKYVCTKHSLFKLWAAIRN